MSENKKKLMDKNLLNVSSRYIIDGIFNYIGNPILKLKLFSYSKFYQKEFNLKLGDYIKVFSIIKECKKYLCCFEEIGDFHNKFYLVPYGNYPKDGLIKLLEDDLKYKYKCDLLFFTQIIFGYFKNFTDYKYKKPILIDIFSPLFDSLSQLKNFDKIFTIPIAINREMRIIEGNTTKIGGNECKINLLNDYISIFDRLNKSNIKYSISIGFHDLYREFYHDGLQFWKNFKINISNASSLYLFDYNNYVNDFDDNYIMPESGTQVFLENLSLFNYIKFSNLKYLKIDIIFLPNEEANQQKLLNFPEVEECDLVEYRFKDRLEKIETGNFFCGDVKSGYLYYGYNNDKSIENLEYNKIFDFSKINNIKILTIDLIDFIHLNAISLEKVNIYSTREIGKEAEIKMLEKLISLKTLKDITFSLKNIEDNEILQINGENNSVINLKLYIFKENFEIYNLQKKFPNLINLSISNLYKVGNYYGDQVCKFCGLDKIDLNTNNKVEGIIIKEEPKCNINKLFLNIGDNSNVKLNISFENLIEIKLIGLINLNNLPIFKKDCNIKFNSLVHFECKVSSIEYLACYEEYYENLYNQQKYPSYSYYYKKEMKYFLNNIYNNIDCMPNLKVFIYIFPSSVEENIYINLIKSLLSRKLDKIILNLYSHINNINILRKYNLNELKAFYPNIIESSFLNYDIKKYMPSQLLEKDN